MTNTKKTSSIYLAAALLAMGARVDKVDRTEPRHMVFYLVSEGETAEKLLDLDELEKQWINRTGDMGHLVKMAEAIQQMKSVIHTA